MFGEYFKEYPLVNKELEKFANTQENCYFVTASGLQANPDGIHMNAVSQRIFGLRYFEAFDKLIVNRNDNFDLADTVAKTQQFMVISNCGFPGNNNFETMKVVFASCNPVLEIYRNCGKLLKSKDEKIKSDVDDYLKAVEQAGHEMATQNSISEETKAGLQKELMSISEYVKYIEM